MTQRAADARAARRLTLAWLVLGIVAIGLSTLYAVILVLARTPLAAGVLSSDNGFRMALVMHVDLAALVWFFSMACALWSAQALARWHVLHWLAFGLGAAGLAAMALAPLIAPGHALPSNYVPLLDNRVFMAGLAWFLAAVTVCASLALARLALPAGRQDGAARDGLEIGAALIAVPTMVAAVSLLWSAATLPRNIDAGLYFELLSWAPGHIAQFAFAVLLMVGWLYLARIIGLGIPRRKVLIGLFVLAALPALLALPIHVLYAADSVSFRTAYTALMAYASWPSPLLFGGWIFVQLLRRGADRTGSAAASSGLKLSLALFSVGCALGVFIRTDSTLVPAHYHGTIGAVTLVLITLLLAVLPQLGFPLGLPRLARWQPRIYGCGLLLMVAGLAWSGGHGAPRKTPYAEWNIDSVSQLAATALTGVGGLLAIVGSALFVAIAGQALLRRAPSAATSAAVKGDGLFAAGSAAMAAAPRTTDDVRPRAIALTLASIAALGLAIATLPNGTAPRALVDSLLTGFTPVDTLSHAAAKRREEVNRRFVQGVMMLHSRQYEHALTAFHRVLELAPEMPEAHANMGFALLGLGRYAAARDFFSGALSLRKEQLNAYYGLAEALAELGDHAAAIGAMRTYVHLAPPDDPYRRKAAAALWEWQARQRHNAPVAKP